MNKDNIRNAKTFDELLDIKYGKIGSEKRDNFEEKAKYFIVSEILKEARKWQMWYSTLYKILAI